MSMTTAGFSRCITDRFGLLKVGGSSAGGKWPLDGVGRRRELAQPPPPRICRQHDQAPHRSGPSRAPPELPRHGAGHRPVADDGAVRRQRSGYRPRGGHRPLVGREICARHTTRRRRPSSATHRRAPCPPTSGPVTSCSRRPACAQARAGPRSPRRWSAVLLCHVRDSGLVIAHDRVIGRLASAGR